MIEWKEIKLADACTKIGSGATPRGGGEAYKENGISLIRSQNVLDFKFSYNGLAFIDNEQANDLKNVIVHENDVLLNITGDSVARVCKVPKNVLPARVNQHVAIIRSNVKQLDSNFLLYQLIKLKEHLLSISEIGATRRAITKGMIESLEIPLPSLTEQTAIASVLTSLDNKIGLLHRQNATLEKMAETLFRQWFVEREGLNYDLLDSYDDRELKNQSNQANQKNQSSDKAEVPNEEWEETILAKHTAVFRGLSYKGDGLTDIGLGLPMHNLNSVYEGGGYKHEGIKFYKGEFRERHLVNPGEIIVTNTEQGHEFKLIGFPAIVPEYYGAKGLFSQHIYKLIPLESSYLSNEFIYYLLMTPDVREQITSATNGSTVNMLAIDGLQRPKFKLPPKALVENFTSTVSIYWKKQTANQTQIRTLTALRDTLLPKLMSGEVRVSEL